MLVSLDEAFTKQKNLLCETKLAFNFDQCVKDVRASLVIYGAPRDHRAVRQQSQWPYLESLKDLDLELYEQEQKLSSLRVTKIAWATVDVICSLQFHFNNGTKSPQLGSQVSLKESVELTEH